MATAFSTYGSIPDPWPSVLVSRVESAAEVDNFKKFFLADPYRRPFLFPFMNGYVAATNKMSHPPGCRATGKSPEGGLPRASLTTPRNSGLWRGNPITDSWSAEGPHEWQQPCSSTRPRILVRAPRNRFICVDRSAHATRTHWKCANAYSWGSIWVTILEITTATEVSSCHKQQVN